MTNTSSRAKKHIFPLEYYDKDLCLKVNFFTMAVMLVCCKSLFASFAALTANGARNTIIQSFFFNTISLEASLIATIPTLIVLITWARRHSRANKIIRTLWHYGKVLLLSSTVMNIAIDIYSITGKPRAQGLDMFLLYIDGLCLLYILRSKMLGAIFQDFPEVACTT